MLFPAYEFNQSPYFAIHLLDMNKKTIDNSIFLWCSNAVEVRIPLHRGKDGMKNKGGFFMKKLIRNTAITALTVTVAAVGVVSLPSPVNYIGKDTVSVAEHSDDSIILLSNYYEYTLKLESFDAAKKIAVIKAVREITGLGLGESKALVEGAPKVLKEGLSKVDVDDFAKKITDAGGKVSIIPEFSPEDIPAPSYSSTETQMSNSH